MTRDDVQRWLDAYVDAWRTYEPAAIAALFSDDVRYAYQPYRDPVVGRDAVVADWLESPDDPGSWEAHYEPYAVDGDRAVAVGTSRYLNPDGTQRTIFYNVWLLRFEPDGRCAEFIEYWREPPSETSDAG
ncbi:MAG TPA: nuclear transport factor 2 family protein [Candidatus Limnocylindrales bacterium]|nr:nuclear transport factor 2 family protein [Candidatus Limnocylindrales bacterium]